VLGTAGKYFKKGVIKFGTLINGKPKGSTANVSRNHVIEESKSGMVSLMGGKWTSFRKMGEETVDHILKSHQREIEPTYNHSITTKFRLLGGYSRVHVTEGIMRPMEEL
jgi:glycerol-3-phosphate dehydrogenase